MAVFAWFDPAKVTEFRAYTVGRDGYFAGFEPIICATDAEAIERARRLLGDQDAIEVWNGPRLVKRIDAGKHKADSHELKDGRLLPKH